MPGSKAALEANIIVKKWSERAHLRDVIDTAPVNLRESRRHHCRPADSNDGSTSGDDHSLKGGEAKRMRRRAAVRRELRPNVEIRVIPSPIVKLIDHHAQPVSHSINKLTICVRGA